MSGSSAPHPRGCSHDGLEGAGLVDVGPAPAGMLPPSRSSSTQSRRRPRTRGDAPGALWIWKRLPWSAPHPRGCSATTCRPSRCTTVGPAPAGMLRPGGPWRGWTGRRPRTRGDAPSTRRRSCSRPSSAPHPRGCSVLLQRCEAVRAVGPAPAGMLPTPLGSATAWPSRPRTRGDAPPTARAMTAWTKSAPHPRGCSPRRPRPLRVSGVGPAPAGMLPRGPQTEGPRPRRPRTRGDAPRPSGSCRHDAQSAPHPRGCSWSGGVAGGIIAVGPAPAGMLPVGGGWGPCRRGRPRTRGDAP